MNRNPWAPWSNAGDFQSPKNWQPASLASRFWLYLLVVFDYSAIFFLTYLLKWFGKFSWFSVFFFFLSFSFPFLGLRWWRTKGFTRVPKGLHYNRSSQLDDLTWESASANIIYWRSFQDMGVWVGHVAIYGRGYKYNGITIRTCLEVFKNKIR